MSTAFHNRSIKDPITGKWRYKTSEDAGSDARPITGVRKCGHKNAVPPCV